MSLGVTRRARPASDEDIEPLGQADPPDTDVEAARAAMDRGETQAQAPGTSIVLLFACLAFCCMVMLTQMSPSVRKYTPMTNKAIEYVQPMTEAAMGYVHSHFAGAPPAKGLALITVASKRQIVSDNHEYGELK